MKYIKKPWGSEELLEKNEFYVVKRLVMAAGHRCSMQYHEKKQETIYVLKGKLRIFYGYEQDKLEEKVFEKNDFITIPANMIHRMEGIEDTVYLEASTNELEDVVRLSDDYKRV